MCECTWLITCNIKLIISFSRNCQSNQTKDSDQAVKAHDQKKIYKNMSDICFSMEMRCTYRFYRKGNKGGWTVSFATCPVLLHSTKEEMKCKADQSTCEMPKTETDHVLDRNQLFFGGKKVEEILYLVIFLFGSVQKHQDKPDEKRRENKKEN